MEESGFSAEPSKLGSSVGDFVVDNKEYYTREFEKIQSATEIPRSWNMMAAIGGPFWGAARGMWGFFWTFMVLEILALVQIGKAPGVNSGPTNSLVSKKCSPRSSPSWTSTRPHSPKVAKTLLDIWQDLKICRR
jgi:hypothetical protein